MAPRPSSPAWRRRCRRRLPPGAFPDRRQALQGSRRHPRLAAGLHPAIPNGEPLCVSRTLPKTALSAAAKLACLPGPPDMQETGRCLAKPHRVGCGTPASTRTSRRSLPGLREATRCATEVRSAGDHKPFDCQRQDHQGDREQTALDEARHSTSNPVDQQNRTLNRLPRDLAGSALRRCRPVQSECRHSSAHRITRRSQRQARAAVRYAGGRGLSCEIACAR